MTPAVRDTRVRTQMTVLLRRMAGLLIWLCATIRRESPESCQNLKVGGDSYLKRLMRKVTVTSWPKFLTEREVLC